MYIVDSHCDSIQKVDSRRYGIVNPYNYSQKFPQLQFVANFCGWPGEDAERSYRRAMRYIGLFKIRMAAEADKVEQVYTYEDIERVFAAGKHAALMSVEGATGIMGSREIFREFYAAGVRVFGMTWQSNDLCASTKLPEGVGDYGLTDTGREIIDEGNKLGMIFDVSHMGELIVKGKDALAFLNKIVPQNISKLLGEQEKQIMSQVDKKIASIKSSRSTSSSTARVNYDGPCYEHVVEAGQTISEIAQAYKVSQREIMDVNNIKDASRIRVGQKLYIPKH